DGVGAVRGVDVAGRQRPGVGRGVEGDDGPVAEVPPHDLRVEGADVGEGTGEVQGLTADTGESAGRPGGLHTGDRAGEGVDGGLDVVDRDAQGGGCGSAVVVAERDADRVDVRSGGGGVVVEVGVGGAEGGHAGGECECGAPLARTPGDDHRVR